MAESQVSELPDDEIGEPPQPTREFRMLARVPEERRGEPAQPNPRTIKGMADERWNAILRAAKGRHETVAEYLWQCHEVRTTAYRPPAVIPRSDQSSPSALSLIELFDVICKFAAVEAAPGNRALLAEARAVLYARLREARASILPPPPPELSGEQ